MKTVGNDENCSRDLNYNNNYVFLFLQRWKFQLRK